MIVIDLLNPQTEEFVNSEEEKEEIKDGDYIPRVRVQAISVTGELIEIEG